MNLYQTLKHYFGYDTLRPGQQDLMEGILNGSDVLGIMPTGAGKSLCYQVPALMLPGITIVISPLISLMSDQVKALNQAGVHAAYINSSLTENQIRAALLYAAQGQYKIIYVAPERLNTMRFLDFACRADISMVTVDEAHCVSQWGQDFRPSYLEIADFLARLPKCPVVSAFTATATERVKQDITGSLHLQNPVTVVTGFDRPNLFFRVVKRKGGKETDNSILNYVKRHEGESGIIYCATKKNVDSVCELLLQHGILAGRYHAGLSLEERKESQDDFTYDRIRVMVATNAFGMGIDKSNVRFVIHYNMPKDLESYYQEAGRAGRDGAEARCILLYSGQDVRTAQFLISQSEPSEQLDPETARQLQERDLGRLKQMTFYCRTRRCLRQYILNYFGQSAPDYCGACYNCLHNFQEIDVGEDARAILRCVAETGQRFGAGLIAAVLCGGENEKIRRYRLERERTYGALAALSQREVQDRIRFLVDEHILELTDGQYPVLRCGERAEDVAYSDGPLMMKAVREERPAADRRRAEDSPLTERQQALFQRLREERAHLARLRGVPAFVIFSDKTLREMAAAQPRDLRQLQNVGGVGSFKAEQYGAQFLEIISDFQETAAI